MIHDLTEDEREVIDSTIVVITKKKEIIGVEMDGKALSQVLIMEAIATAKNI